MNSTAARRLPVRFLLVPWIVSLLAIAAGAIVCILNDIPTPVWARNPAAWVVGGIAAGVLWRTDSRALTGFLPLALIALAGTFLGPDQSGVHRWISLGPLSINAAMLLLPPAIVSLAAYEAKARWPWLVALACMALLAAQPDRSQSIALGVSVLWLAVRSMRTLGSRILVAALTGGLMIAAVLRPDPLSPVPEVEGILQLAFAASPALAGLALMSLVACCLLPIWIVRQGAFKGRLAGEALALYFIVAAVMPFLGAYPVPLVGVGVSPVLGASLAFGALAASWSVADEPRPASNEGQR